MPIRLLKALLRGKRTSRNIAVDIASDTVLKLGKQAMRDARIRREAREEGRKEGHEAGYREGYTDHASNKPPKYRIYRER